MLLFLRTMNQELKAHWENIYENKQPHEVSWTQDKPEISLRLIHETHASKDAAIIDIGGGDSKLVDFLLAAGYTNISVLDISEAAINRAKKRLGEKAKLVKWIVSDILEFQPKQQYDIWHDRAAFHFQTENKDIETYLERVEKSVCGNLIIGTFSTDGPLKCSGLEIMQYNEESMNALFNGYGFTSFHCEFENHQTPSGNIQHFIFCMFVKNK
jgi:hypothetical protein